VLPKSWTVNLLIDLDDLTPDDMRHIAAAREARRKESFVRLPDDARAEYVEMLIEGRRPGLGWWRRHALPRPLKPQPPMQLAQLPGVVRELQEAGCSIECIVQVVLDLAPELDDETVAHVVAGGTSG
jgi:hypothetical protein